MSQRTRLRVAAGALVLAGLATLTACGDEGKTVSSVNGSKVHDDESTVATTAGTATMSKELPEGFPTDVPLLDETVLSGTEGRAGGPFTWSVVMQSSRSVDDLSAEVRKDYASWKSDAGTGTSLGDVSILHFAGNVHEVGVTIARTGGNVTITYVVKNAG